MSEASRAYSAIDRFRLVAAAFVVAIHVAPFETISPDLDAALVYTLGRIAVPFFLATTGFFTLGGHRPGSILASRKFRMGLSKLAKLYALATAIYLPVALYAGELPGTFGGVLRFVLVDGTFYHLWYFPAALVGSVLVAFLLDRFGVRAAVGASCALYAVGLFGDSYFGAADAFGPTHAAYEAMFSWTSYTRNGLFYAPIFLLVGVLCRKTEQRQAKRSTLVGLVILLASLLLAEGMLVHAWGLARHDSMYLLLPPTVYCLFKLLLSVSTGHRARWAGPLSLWVYVLHPLCLIGVRGVAKATGTFDALAGNSLALYVAVLAASVLAGFAALQAGELKNRAKAHLKGRRPQ